MDPEPDLVNGFEEFEVEEILDHRVHQGETRFLVKWKGYSDLLNSWEPEENLGNCKESLADYKRRRNVSLSKIGILHEEEENSDINGL